MAIQPPVQDEQGDTQARTMLGCSECAEGEVLSTTGPNAGAPEQTTNAVASAMQQVMDAYKRGEQSRPPVSGMAKQSLTP